MATMIKNRMEYRIQVPDEKRSLWIRVKKYALDKSVTAGEALLMLAEIGLTIEEGKS